MRLIQQDDSFSSKKTWKADGFISIVLIRGQFYLSSLVAQHLVQT